MTVMRRFLISVLLAGAATSPALAQDNPDPRWHHNQQQNDNGQAREQRRQERDQARAERSNPERQQQQQQQQAQARGFDRRSERANSAPPAQMPPQAYDRSRFERVNSAPPARVPPPQAYGRGYRGGNGFAGGQAAPPEQVDRRNWNGDEPNWRRGGRDARQGAPDVRSRGPLIVSTVPREGTQPPPRYGQRSWSASNWNRNWRGDDRYDWRDWRRSHRTTFHIGIYYDPFGWGYRPYEIGWRMWPNYYSQQYWIDDPWMYRLPYAPPGLVWVRYWDDAVLIDTYTGEVVDVIHDFFW